MEEQDKQKCIKGRDLFNENIDPLRNKYPKITKIQDVMNRDINKEIYASIQPPIPQLPEEWTYKALKRVYSAYFLKGALCLQPTRINYEEEYYFEVIDTIAKYHLSNDARAFFWLNESEKANREELLVPHPLETRIINNKKITKYNLHIIDPAWENQVFNHLDFNATRRITTDVIVNDGHSIRNWASHWLNGDNNWGWHDRPTYLDKYGWTHWVHLNDPNYGNEDERARYEATRDYLLFYYQKYLPRLAGYIPYVRLSNNEMEAGDTWHGVMGRIANQYGFTRPYMVSSVLAADWYLDKPNIRTFWIPEIHGVNTIERYYQALGLLPEGFPCTVCADGGGESWITDEIPDVIRQATNDGNDFIGNSEGVWKHMDYLGGYIVRNAFKGALK